MNGIATYQIWHNRSLRPLDKLTLLALARLCPDRSDRCLASLRYLSAMLNMDPGTVHRSIRTLEEQGYITRYQRHRRAPTEYTLHPTR